MEKILIRKNQSAEADFMRGLNDTVFKANALIDLFNGSQPFVEIRSMIEFVNLLHNPVYYYDQTVRDNIQHDSRLAVSPGKLCELYNIPRQQYLVGLGMSQAQASKCQDCKAEKDTGVRLKVLSPNQYLEFAEFLMFVSGRVQSDARKVELHRETFTVYAQSDRAVSLVNHYKRLTEVLNDAIAFHGLGTSQIAELARIFDLLVLNNKLIVNDMKLAEKISYMQ